MLQGIQHSIMLASGELALTLSSLRTGYKAIVIGASGGIGSAFIQHLQADPRCSHLTGLSRQSMPPLVLEDEPSIETCARALGAQGPFHLVLDATGALTIDGLGPEKRLNELDALRLRRTLEVNAIGPALLLKHFVPLLAKSERVIWAKLSARVGSIEDNYKGGWYGYRASKAALNMLLQSAAIEIARQRPLAVVAALQPGTVRTSLTRPFVGDAAESPREATCRLLQVIDALDASGRAHFVDHRGEQIPW